MEVSHAFEFPARNNQPSVIRARRYYRRPRERIDLVSICIELLEEQTDPQLRRAFLGIASYLYESRYGGRAT